MFDDLKLPAGTHEDVLGWMSKELDGELPERERIFLSDHLSGCPPCASVAAQLRAASRTLRADARARPPVGLSDRILARIARAGEPARPVAAVADASRAGGALHPRAGGALHPRAGGALQMLRWSAALAAGLLALASVAYVAQSPKTAVAANQPTLRTADAALMRVLDRWQKGRAAAPSFFELLLAPAPKAAPKSR